MSVSATQRRLAVLLTATASGAHAATGNEWAAPEPWFIYLVLALVFLGALLSLTLIRTALANPRWSLADALSEESEITSMEADGDSEKPRLDAAGKPITVIVMRASASRVIALMGMMVILLMFIGFGVFSLYFFAVTGGMPASVDDIVKFLLGGLTLFAPYVANKFAAMFESLAPKKN